MSNEQTDTSLPGRKQIRLPDYDYSQPGSYFVTICTFNKQPIFGNIVDGAMKRNPYGEIAAACWKDIPLHYPEVKNDVSIVMPNHVHGIIVIEDGVKQADLKTAPAKKHPLPEIIRAFKTFSAKRINELRSSGGTQVWQKGYYEHVIRDEEEFTRIGEYVLFNPAKWETDRENPDIKVNNPPQSFES
jgi:putative transposase